MVADGAYGDRHFLMLKESIFQRTSLDCSQYKDSYLKRRFASRMRARGASSYADYLRFLASHPEEYDALLNDITINVTQFFRDPPVFKAVEEEIFPLMIYNNVKRGSPVIKVLSAGCSSGEEPYSIAIILHDLLGEEVDNFDVQVQGTDIDDACLRQAEEGRYLPRQVTNVPRPYLKRYFSFDGERYVVRPEIKRMVRLSHLDLFSQALGHGFDCIFCRNVVIYFTREQQERLFMRFYRSLNDGGFLVIGNTETLTGEAAQRLSSVRPREHIYQKAEGNMPSP